jgi:hypothetical protein
MLPIAFALSVFLAGQPAEPAAEAAAAPVEDRLPAGAPRDDYAFVAWCYGSLRAYLDLHDQVMPEVTRIEGAFRRPGSKLSDDLKVYDDMQKTGRSQLRLFQGAMTAAEKASMRPINTIGAAAVSQGRAVWKVGPEVTKARLAQEWMSWTLPDRCEKTARSLEQRATLLGASFRANAEPEPAPATPEAAGESRAAALLNGPLPAAPN